MGGIGGGVGGGSKIVIFGESGLTGGFSSEIVVSPSFFEDKMFSIFFLTDFPRLSPEPRRERENGDFRGLGG